MERAYRSAARARVAGFCLFAIALALAAFAWFDGARPAGTPTVTALQLAFSGETFGDIIARWGLEGVRAFRQSTIYVDYWFPVAYALFLASLSALLTVKPGQPPSRLHLTYFALPFIGGLLDWVENTLHLILLRHPTNLSPSLVLLASLAAVAKWGLIAAAMLAVLFLGVRRLTQGSHSAGP